ncbi:protein snakeskin-like [Portunus trituberculatus]|uniref:protein snakeskin-like n=1 Tax=Portunus trituberculatus TaxID=210409 RepID=UPI001E1CF887|nr:protein snakeskin-like [Portunus trituberculatus]XP_045112838.1 protein snakeskin-like [Portunus trituberculatus]
MQLSLEYLRTPPGILKLVEIATVVVAFGIFRGSDARFALSRSQNFATDADFFGCGVLVTALIITPLLLTCYIMGRYEIQKTIFEIVFNFLMFVFMLSAGSVAVDSFKNVDVIGSNMENTSLAMGSFCIIASFAYLVDTVFAVHLYRK